MKSNADLSKIQENYHQLLRSQQSLILATASSNAVPESSYSPYIRGANGDFYIFISELAQHTQNLLHNPKASILFIAEESQCHNVFARERAIFAVQGREIPRADPSYNPIMQSFAETFGSVIPLLNALNDFHLFALTPQQGRYIMGFGNAYTIDIVNDTLAALISPN